MPKPRLFNDKSTINSIKNRFYSKVLLPNDNGCMEWIGCFYDKKAYGAFSINRKNNLSHRYSYKLHFGKIPKNLWVLHKCDNKKCVAPEHLFLGTPKDNTQDMIQKGRKWDLKGEKSGTAKLTDKDVYEIKDKLSKKIHQEVISKEYGVSQYAISKIKRGKTWIHLQGAI